MNANSLQTVSSFRKAWDSPSLSCFRRAACLPACLLLCAAAALPQTAGPLRPRRPPPDGTDEAAAPLPPVLGGTARNHADADPLIRLARAVNADFTKNLPNFIAKRRVKRFVSFNRGRIWALEDTIEAEVPLRGPQGDLPQHPHRRAAAGRQHGRTEPRLVGRRVRHAAAQPFRSATRFSPLPATAPETARRPARPPMQPSPRASNPRGAFTSTRQASAPLTAPPSGSRPKADARCASR